MLTRTVRQQIARGRDKDAAVLASLRAEQRDPAHGGPAAQMRGTKNAAHQRAVREWAGERPDHGVFTAEILPGIRRHSVPELMAATGLSERYRSLIRLGKRVPHPRHWQALRDTGNGAGLRANLHELPLASIGPLGSVSMPLASR